MNIIPPMLRKLYAPQPVALSVAEFESLLGKGIAQSRNDNDIDGCIAIMKRYRGKGPAYDAAIRRLGRGILLQRLRINGRWLPIATSFQLQ
ncbi:MAG: hypothetical protein EOP56_08095 [Sphingobacteriales bacterium]|nr:MAG: hypothetical protein EOP56_08095 [Sphingobacteriales bacterium]